MLILVILSISPKFDYLLFKWYCCKALKEEIMNNISLYVMYYEFAESLTDFFQECEKIDLSGFEVITNGMVNGSISDGDMIICYVFINDDEMLYVYQDSEGKIWFNTGNFNENFVNIGDKTYLGYDMLQKKPFEFVQKVTDKLNNYFKENEFVKKI